MQHHLVRVCVLNFFEFYLLSLLDEKNARLAIQPRQKGFHREGDLYWICVKIMHQRHVLFFLSDESLSVNFLLRRRTNL